MARKKQKALHNVSDEATTTTKRDLISTLPWELIADILSMTSPREVLALARCSRYFCNSLVVNPRSKRIWEASRKSCKPLIPNPTPNFTEPAYASLIFDGGPCEQCGKFVNNFYTSFSLRLRVCTHTCYTKWKEQNGYVPDETEANKEVESWLVGSEGINHGYDSYKRRFYRRSDFLQAVEEYWEFVGKEDRKGVPLYRKFHEKDRQRKAEILSLATNLVTWTSTRSEVSRSVKAENHTMLALIALQMGWKIDDVRNAPTCLEFYRRHNLALETFKEHDFNVIKPAVEAEVIKAMKKRARSEEEQSYAKRRKLVEQEYHRRRSVGQNPPVLPTIDVFRQQDVIRAMQNLRSDPEVLSKQLTVPSIQEMIEKRLSDWRDDMKTTFAGLLGTEEYPVINSNKLQPTDRLTARFVCKKCLERDPDETNVASLDFREACAHRCDHLSKRQKLKAKWSPDQFAPDQKAIKITQKLLALLGTSEDQNESTNVVDVKRDRILCKNCDGKIVMNFRVMQQHSHRHEDMEVDFLSIQRIKELPLQPIQWGLCAELTSMAKSASRKAELKEYGCRHCLRAEGSVEQPEADSTNLDSRKKRIKKSGKNTKQQKLMSFHGLRCHVLQSHGITNIADEDVYRVEAEAKTS